MPMDYDNESEPQGGRAQAGRYRFKVDFASEERGEKGKYAKVTLLADVGGRDMKVFTNLSYSPKALWKLKEFMTSIGLDFHGKNELWDMVGQTGVADFVVGYRGYLEAKMFLPRDGFAPTSGKAAEPKLPPGAAASDDSIPF